MIAALEIVAAIVLTGTLVATVGVAAAFQLGRMISRDDQQRDVAARPGGTRG